jgi:hypothetical protein
MSRRLIPATVLPLLLLVPAAPAADPEPDLATRLAQLPGELVKAKKSDAEVVDALFLAALARLPKDAERETAARHLAKATDREKAAQDVLFALVNTKEFMTLRGMKGGLEALNEFNSRMTAVWEKK